MKKNKFVFILIILVIIFSCTFIYTLISYLKLEKGNTKIKNTLDKAIKYENITTSIDSTIHIVNEYDENMFKNHYSIVFFWASWCSHCNDEYETLINILETYQDKNFKIYIISHDYDLNELQTFIEENNFNYDIYFDKEHIIRSILDKEASSVPLTYILDKNGVVIDKFDGTINIADFNEMLKNNNLY